MLLEQRADILGQQIPPIQSVPDIASTASAEETIEVAQLAGLILDPWQKHILRITMGEREDGKWAAFIAAIIVARQNGKNAVLEARELAGLFHFGERLIIHTAHEFKAAAEHFRRILELIENTPDFDRRVKRVGRSHGDESIELKGGQRLRFLARSKGSGRSFSGDCVVLDEALFLQVEQLGALLPTLSARPNPQVWITSSAGNQQSSALGRIVRAGRAGTDKSLAYAEWSPAEGDAPDDIRTWAKTNPGLGIRITAEHIQKEFDVMDFTEFARERLSIGTYPSEDGNQWEVIDEVCWRDAADTASELQDPVVFAVDIAPDRSYASIAAAGSRKDAKRHIEVIDHEPGTGWVAERLKSLNERWKPYAVALDAGGPAGSLIRDLEAKGLTLTKLGAAELGQACGAFHDAVVEGTVRHRGQPELTAAVRYGKKRTLGEAWAWSRRDAAANPGPLIASTIALYVHVSTVKTKRQYGAYFMD